MKIDWVNKTTFNTSEHYYQRSFELGFHFFVDGLRLGFPLIIDARATLTEWQHIIATARTSLIRIYIAWVQPLSLGIYNVGTLVESCNATIQPRKFHTNLESCATKVSFKTQHYYVKKTKVSINNQHVGPIM